MLRKHQKQTSTLMYCIYLLGILNFTDVLWPKYSHSYHSSTLTWDTVCDLNSSNVNPFAATSLELLTICVFSAPMSTNHSPSGSLHFPCAMLGWDGWIPPGWEPPGVQTPEITPPAKPPPKNWELKKKKQPKTHPQLNSTNKNAVIKFRSFLWLFSECMFFFFTFPTLIPKKTSNCAWCKVGKLAGRTQAPKDKTWCPVDSPIRGVDSSAGWVKGYTPAQTNGWILPKMMFFFSKCISF